jgi:DNA-binding transcriptional LysR family regulator
VRAGEVDFAIGPVPADRLDTDLASRALFSSRSVIVVRRGHPLARARSLAALADADWVLTGPAGGPGDPAALGFEALGLAPPRVRLACESFSTVLAMIGAGDVVCVMPQRFVERHAARLELVQVPVADPLPDSPILAVWRTDVPLTLPARRLLDAFGQEARGLA